MVKKLRHYLKQNDWIFDLYMKLKVERQLFDFRLGKEPVLIFNLGKVGSTSIRKTLESSGSYSVFNAHKLSEEGLKRSLRYGQEEGVKDLRGHRRNTRAAAYQANRIKKSLIGRNGSKVKIITLTRLPLGRAISAIFENIQYFYPDIESNQNSIDIHKLVNEYSSQCTAPEKGLTWLDIPSDWRAGPLAFDWFDFELKKFTGIDVFTEPFPKDDGFKIYTNDNFEILLIRLEDLSSVIDEAFLEFFGKSNLKLINDNVGEKKTYSSLYTDFKDDLSFDPDFIKSMHNTKYAKHFYTAEELDKECQKFI